MKKKAIIILAVACIGMSLFACGEEKEHIDKESEINVYKEEYTPEKKHREDTLELKKGDSEIEVNVKATSGEFKVTFLDKDNESLSYEYKVKAGDNVSDTISLDADTLGDDWVLIMEKNEDTDASLKYIIK